MSTRFNPAESGSAVSAVADTAAHTTRSARPLDRVRRNEEAARGILLVVSVPALRVALGVVFVWFGALKVVGKSPIADLVASMLPYFPADTVVVGLGVFEVVAGLALLVGVLIPWVCAAMVGHLMTTFLVAIVHPTVAFNEGNPFLATMCGEFIAKNLVLIAAALVVAAFSGPQRTR